jgi:hypothetical protein
MSEQQTQEEKSGGLFGFWNDAAPIGQTAIIMGGLVALFVLFLLIAVILGLVLGDSGGVAHTVSIIRDLFIILLVVQGMLIGLALIVLILQIASIVNLVENELKPVARSVQETANTIKGTAEFMSENVASPVIESQAWLAGFATLVREATSLRKAFRKEKPSSPEEETSDDQPDDTPTETDAE